MTKTLTEQIQREQKRWSRKLDEMNETVIRDHRLRGSKKLADQIREERLKASRRIGDLLREARAWTA